MLKSQDNHRVISQPTLANQQARHRISRFWKHFFHHTTILQLYVEELSATRLSQGLLWISVFIQRDFYEGSREATPGPRD